MGLGLIGGSLALALRRRGVRVIGIDRDRATLAAALRRRAIGVAADSIADGVRGAAMVVLAVPLQSLSACIRAVAVSATRDAVVTDVASVKAPVLALARRALPHPARFVGGHPMAGSERPGFANARADLFRNRVAVLTPVAGTSRLALRSVRRLWRTVGARAITMNPERHDAAVARASHLPHLIAFALAPVIADRDARRVVPASFLDATRVAASDPALWEGILLANRRNLVRAAREQARRSGSLLRAVRTGRPGPLRRLLRTWGAIRRRAAEPS